MELSEEKSRREDFGLEKISSWWSQLPRKDHLEPEYTGWVVKEWKDKWVSNMRGAYKTTGQKRGEAGGFNYPELQKKI